MKNQITMQGMNKSFFATRALDNVDFACAGGAVHALVGLNGAGKSTLMKILGGIYRADEGQISMNGKDVRIDSPADATALGVSMIHQEYSPINELTIAGNIFLGRELRRAGAPFLDKAEMARQVREQLDRFGLDLDPYRPVRDPNSDEKQIVEIVRALMSKS
ncbi:MAG: ATP-binding cassette domain-containing protein [Geminicoccaceae bacterium]